MGKSLVIVESPAKANTINKFLGSTFIVKASVGHVKDLPQKELGVDIEHDFKPSYVTIRGRGKIIKELKRISQDIGNIYLAPDPDREGEAIAWHIAEELKDRGKRIYRVLVNEITKKAVLDAIKNPVELQRSKYEAQQARRILDRLVGYQISPLLWDKVRRGLSAGRVQSVAVRIICERESEINTFIPKEYWTITARLKKRTSGDTFEAKLAKVKGEKADVSTGAMAKEIMQELEGAAFIVSRVERKERKRYAPPPFITSKLQQEAARKLRFSAKKTMRVAQKLYEGIELGEAESVGLITYMRTDSTRISEEALKEVRNYIGQRFGAPFLPDKPIRYRSKKGAQEAHEAIRPTSMELEPERMASYLDKDQRSLYKLIWDRFVASQMMPALFDQTMVEVEARDYLFSGTGSVQRFPGFMALYIEGEDEEKEDGEKKVGLPELRKGEQLTLISLSPEQRFTQPPPRFTEATLVKELEERGIGRPSTYATILSTIQEKDYIRLAKGKFVPTELGLLVTDLLVGNFPHILDVEFTARMEDKLDKIEEEKVGWVRVLRQFYGPFRESLEKAKTSMRDVKRKGEMTDIPCDVCGNPMVIKWGKMGQFLACSTYPKCTNTKDFFRDGEGRIVIETHEDTEHRCDRCGRPMVVKNGKFGKFLACSDYPRCQATKPLTLGIPCPSEGCGGELVEKRTRKGRVFYGCSDFPRCQFATWGRPVREQCPRCGAPFLIEKFSRRGEVTLHCVKDGCRYRGKAPQ
ncbi:MAG: type I DNA topoisomerase [Syntrophobacterales bacterium]|nr:MAG: type I DNA topoisomerase [Syntrophobacterales bacterium]